MQVFQLQPELLRANQKQLTVYLSLRDIKIGGPGSKSSKCVSFEVPAGTTDIVVYGEPAGSSGTRSVVINDGSENKTVLTTQMSAKYTLYR